MSGLARITLFLAAWLVGCTGATEPSSGVVLCKESGEEGWLDADADGYGDPRAPGCGPGTVANAGDCNDASAAVNSGAEEACDGVDEDCDGEIDEAPADPLTVYLDQDGDGHGDPASALSLDGCDVPPGYVVVGDDCDDADVYRAPSAAELCDGLDNRCDPLWEPSSEEGHVTYQDEQGVPFDLTLAFQGGTPLAPGQIDLPGGTLLVCPGSYVVNLHVFGPTSIIGRNQQSTALDGGEGRTIDASADLWISGLSLVGGEANGGDGGAIRQEGGALSVWNSELRNNTAGRGGAIAYFSAGTYQPLALELISVNFANNDAERGGALYVDTGGSVYLNSTSFAGNVAAGDGGAIAIDEASSVQLDLVELQENIAVGRGGGLFVQASGSVFAFGGTLIGNAATGQGGGGYLAASQVVLDATLVASNLAGDVGGGLAVFGQPSAELRGVSLFDNATPLDGGGLYLYTGEGWLTDLYVDHNEVTALGVGGGAAVWATTLWVTGGQYNENAAQSGGGLFVAGSSEQSSAVLDLPVLTNNRAEQTGGALQLDLPVATLTNAVLSSNTALQGGGLSMSQGVITLGPGASLEDNRAGEGGALHIASGTLSCGDADGTSPPSLLRNSANSGGALLLAGQASSFLASGCDVGGGQDGNIAYDGSSGDAFLEEAQLGYDFEGLVNVSCTATECSP